MRELTMDVRYALRRMRNAPMFAVVTVATLALGLVLHAVWRVFGRRPVLGTG